MVFQKFTSETNIVDEMKGDFFKSTDWDFSDWNESEESNESKNSTLLEILFKMVYENINTSRYTYYQWISWSRSYKTFFSSFFFFRINLGHFTFNTFFMYVTKTQAYHRKTEKFFVSKEKSLVGSTPVFR
jgi:hypothetical protein